MGYFIMLALIFAFAASANAGVKYFVNTSDKDNVPGAGLAGGNGDGKTQNPQSPDEIAALAGAVATSGKRHCYRQEGCDWMHCWKYFDYGMWDLFDKCQADRCRKWSFEQCKLI